MKGGPAPNAYKLPPAFGYNCHDTTKHRNPAFTIRVKLPDDNSRIGPSLYNVRDKTRFGVAKAPAYTIVKRPHDIYVSQAPPPSTYAPEKCTANKPRVPQYTMGQRIGDKLYDSSPGPQAYKLPTVLGPKIPDKHCNGAFTLLGKARDPIGQGNPGPNKYYPCNISAYKPSAPKYTISQRVHPPEFKTQVPAPNRYCVRPSNLRSQPGYTFGSKHSDITGVYLTMDDVKAS